MNYELAKELKDAGLPQGHYQKIFDEVKEYPKRAAPYAEAYGVTSLDEIIYYPTLSELIEACGDCLSHLKKHYGAWWAVSHCGHEEHEPGGNNLEEADQDLNIAVARLWLALNRHH